MCSAQLFKFENLSITLRRQKWQANALWCRMNMRVLMHNECIRAPSNHSVLPHCTKSESCHAGQVMNLDLAEHCTKKQNAV